MTGAEKPRYSKLRLLSDEGLMACLNKGHHDALGVLFDRYHLLVFKISLRILRDPEEAEDLTQSIFLELLHSPDKFDASKGTAKVWILQYAYHRSFSRRRYLNLRGISKHPQGAETELLEETTGLLPGSLGSLESAHFVRQALGHLTDMQRKTIEMAFFEGFTMEEIARQTGESYVSIRHYYYRGLAKLRRVLAPTTVSDQSQHKRPAEGAEVAHGRP
jgi:RNA polymerase sigma-70 factor (ECF subfamily)